MIRLRTLALALTFLSLMILAGCSTTGKYTRGGGYYKDDGPPSNPPADIASTPDAVPHIETYLASASKPYEVFGKEYVPVKPNQPYEKRGVATWYGRKFNGQKTASGERYNMYAMTAAHPTLPIPSYARVIRPSTGKSIIVRINDRGPFHSSRIIDLSYAAASKLGLIGHGSDQVIVQAITNDDIRKGDYEPTHTQPAEPVAAPTTPIAPVASIPPLKSSAPSPAAPQLAYARSSDAASDTSGVYLQFGAFSAEQNARHLARKLNQQIAGMESRPATVDPGAHWYRVQIGPYPDREAADHAAVRIKEATGSAATVTVR